MSNRQRLDTPLPRHRTAQERAPEFVTQHHGQPLDTETCAFAEPRFAHDLANIRIHSDAAAVRADFRLVDRFCQPISSNTSENEGVLHTLVANCFWAICGQPLCKTP